MTINGSLLVSIPIAKRFSVEVPPKRVPKMAVFRENGGLNVTFYFQNPQRHILARNRVFWSILREGQCGGLGCGREEEPKKRNNSRTMRSYISPIWGEQNPGPIWTKFCTEGDIRDVITLANFGIDRFRGFSEGSNFRFLHRLLPSSL